MELNSFYAYILINRDEFIDACLQYNIPVDLQFFDYKWEMWSYFERSITT